MIWTWLIAQGLYRDLLSACILVPIMRGWLFKPFRQVAELLDSLLTRDEAHRDLMEALHAVMGDKREPMAQDTPSGVVHPDGEGNAPDHSG